MPEPDPIADSPLSSSGWKPRAVHLVLATLVAGGMFLFRLAQDLPLSAAECLVGQTTREMDATDNWLVPRFSDEPQPARPPLAYWMAALSGRLLGRLDALSLRLPSAVAGFGCLLALGSLARTLFGRRVAFATMILFASAAGTLHYTHVATVDAQLMFWCLLSVLAFEHGLRSQSRPGRRAWLATFYACLGVAMLARMPLPLLLVPPGLLAYLFVTRRIGEVPRLFLLPGLVILTAVFGWWIIAIGRTPSVGFDSLRLTWEQKLLPWLSAGRSQGSEQLWFPLVVLAALSLPWTFWLPEALAAPYLKRYAADRRCLWLPWCLLATSLVILMWARFKRIDYVVPSLPWAALLLGVVTERHFFRTAEREPPASHGFVLLAAALVIGLGVAAYELAGALGNLPETVLSRSLLVLWLAGAAILLALWLFEAGHPRTAFLAVGISGTVAFVVLRTFVAPLAIARPNYFGFAEGLRQVVSIPAADDLQWVSPPDPRLVFHTNQTCKAVLSPLQVAAEQRKARRAGTRLAPEQLIHEAVLRRLQGPEPFFAVGEARQIEAWSDRPDYARVAHTIYRYPAFNGDPDSDLVVVTNYAGTAYVRREGKRLIRFAGAAETQPAVPGRP